MRLVLAPLVLCFLPACLIPAGNTPAVALSIDAATQFNHRGMPQNKTGVLQPAGSVTLPAIAEGSMTLATWGNIDLQDDVGDAWYPDGNGGRFSQIDYVGTYSKFFGATTASTGLHNYNPTRGDRFPFGVRGSTVEIFARGEHDLGGGWFPFAELRVDVDEAEGWYTFAGMAKSIPINEKVSAEIEAYISYIDDDQAFWEYALDESGLADARLTGKAFYQFDDSIRFVVLLALSTMIDSDFRDGFDNNDIDPDNFWLSAGVTWSY